MIKLYKNQIIILFLLSVFAPVSVVALDLFDSDDEGILWQAGVNQYFKYVKQDDSEFGKNEHPVELDEKDIRFALKALQYNDKAFLKGEIRKSVFSISQITILSKQIAKGLRLANSTQDIVFVLQGSKKALAVLTRKYAVAGRIFYKEGKLNIILGEYELARNDAFEKVYDPGGYRELPYNFNLGRRSKSSNKFDGDLTGITGIDNKRTDNEIRQDWIRIDVAVASKAYVTEKDAKENASTTKFDRKLQEESAKLAKQRREMRAEMARMRKQVKDIENNKAPISVKSIEERMAMLDQLLGKKLITQEEYDSKRQDILNDI